MNPCQSVGVQAPTKYRQFRDQEATASLPRLALIAGWGDVRVQGSHCSRLAKFVSLGVSSVFDENTPPQFVQFQESSLVFVLCVSCWCLCHASSTCCVALRTCVRSTSSKRAMLTCRGTSRRTLPGEVFSAAALATQRIIVRARASMCEG